MTDTKVRQRAYEIWEREGRVSGREDAHWAQAHAEIHGSEAAPTKTKAAGKTPATKIAATKSASAKTGTTKVKAPADEKPAAAKKPAKAAAGKSDKAADVVKASAAKKPRGDTSRGSLH